MNDNCIVRTIALLPDEQALAKKIDFDVTPGKISQAEWVAIADAMLELVRSLRQRKAIPRPRVLYFTDPRYNIGGYGLSRQQVFEKNGVKGEAVLRHPHFLRHLRYLLHGADLPDAIIDQFWDHLRSCGDMITSGDLPVIRALARRLIRSHGLPPPDACEEFYKLALDCGLDESWARSIRKSVMEVR